MPAAVGNRVMGCGIPDDIENASIAFNFGGDVVADGGQTPISGIQVTLVQLDSMNAAGMGVTVTGDTSSTSGSWLTHIEVARPGSACDNRNRPLLVTLRFSDTRNRYAPTVSHQTLCRFTSAELSAARALLVSLAPI